MDIEISITVDKELTDEEIKKLVNYVKHKVKEYIKNEHGSGCWCGGLQHHETCRHHRMCY